MKNRTDAELVALARAGGKDAFGQLIERYQGMAKRIARGRVADEDIARELAQEAMLQAYLSLDRLRDDTRFKNWLYGIVLNVCRSYIRDQKMVLYSLEAMAEVLPFGASPFSGTVPDPQEAAEQQELHGRVLEAVNALSPKHGAATLLFYYGQLSLREVAKVLGISVGTVKGRLHRARKQLRKRLLPLYSETSQSIEGKRGMIKVTIADVVEQKKGQSYVIVLHDQAGHRVLPIWIGPFEAWSIAVHLLEHSPSRPLTHDFMTNLLATAGVELEEVRVEALKEDTFYAVAKLRSGEAVQEVDARPSDAIALALRTGSPVYVAEEVMGRGGADITDDTGQAPQLGRGLKGIMQEWEGELKAAGPPACSTEEQREEAYQELIDFLRGGET